MSVVPAQMLRAIKPVKPFCERTKLNGMTYGVSAAGYDIRIAESVVVHNNTFILASSLEQFEMPDHLLAYVKDKSTWARQGLCVQNTVIEPGWRGYLTLELTNHSLNSIVIKEGTPIAQIIFHILYQKTSDPYKGKYQDQPKGAQEPIFEE